MDLQIEYHTHTLLDKQKGFVYDNIPTIVKPGNFRLGINMLVIGQTVSM